MSMIETKTARVEVLEGGIVCVRILPGLIQGLAEAVENLEAAMRAANGVRRPLLVDIRVAKMLQPEAREYYGKKGLDGEFTALALLIQSSVLGTIMGNIYMRVARHAVPVRLFMSEPKAMSWLRGIERSARK